MPIDNRTKRPDLFMPWIQDLPERKFHGGLLHGFYKNSQNETVEFWLGGEMKRYARAYIFMGISGEEFFKEWQLKLRVEFASDKDPVR